MQKAANDAGRRLGAQPAGAVPDITDHDRNFYQYGSNGLTKRELFAAMAMQGVLASSPVWGPDQLETQAVTAVQLADALLAELAKDGAA